jgi:hypothetical protein
MSTFVARPDSTESHDGHSSDWRWWTARCCCFELAISDDRAERVVWQ